MAISGCIIAECILCDDWIWESQALTIDDHGFYHNACALDANNTVLLKRKNGELLAENLKLRLENQKYLNKISNIESGKPVQMDFFS